MPIPRIAHRLQALVTSGNNKFATEGPSAQATIDAVPSAWASQLPIPGVVAGKADLFDDPRVRWAIEQLGGVDGAECVELGPLEGGHTYMLEQAGAASVTAIEANNNAFLKCLVVKELLDMRRSSFLYGDVVSYLEARQEPFDVCWCSGILYHMVDPVRLIEACSRRASRLYIWTHYYDGEILVGKDGKAKPFVKKISSVANHNGFMHTLHRQEYGTAPGMRSFWGGTQGFSNWMELDSIVGALEHFGWTGIQTRLEADHPHGPAVNLTAVRA
jgi:SAM-dependent methyltransferase